MTILATLYILSGVLAMAACVPQIIQLVKVKYSDEFELRTWVLWLGTQIISVAYFIILNDIVVLLVALGWAIFYAIMVYLIIHYRYLHKTLETPQLTPAPVHVKIK
jgi:Ca2+/Na+ antiporter